MNNKELSSHGQKLIAFYKEIASSGVSYRDGTRNENAYNDFQLRKFRNIVQSKLVSPEIRTVLDYGGGGSDWDAGSFDADSGSSAKEFFKLDNVIKFEPARNMLTKAKADCVVCMDVLEHVFIADINMIVEELFELADKLLIVNVACYKAAALLPNNENAHVTVRSPDWWKGIFDVVSTKFPEIEVFLICSTSFSAGIVFDCFRSSDWHSSNTFCVEPTYRTFGAA